MRVMLVGKYPPIQGGVSRLIYWTVQDLLRAGISVDVVTNADECPLGYRQCFLNGDEATSSSHDGLTVQSTSAVRDFHIPYSNPFLTKLIGLSAETVRARPPDLIIGWYWEPYGLAAAMVGALHNIPVALVHAGSDLGRLAQQPHLRSAYKLALDHVSYVVTSRHADVVAALDALQVAPEKRIFFAGGTLPAVYQVRQRPLELPMLRDSALSYFHTFLGDVPELRYVVRSPLSDASVPPPVIVLYGKMGRFKGTFELIAALDQLGASGQDFSLVHAAVGDRSQYSDLFAALASRKFVGDRYHLVPPLAPWQIPPLLALGDMAAFLENRFPISFHTPSVPFEILSSGKALICSLEILQKSMLHKHLVDAKNVIVVPDPANIEQLSSVLSTSIHDRQRLRSIGKHGKQVAASLLTAGGTAHILSNLIECIQGRPSSHAAA